MQSYTVFIGIDISKKWIDVCLTLDGQKSQMPHQQFDNNVKGFQEMLKFTTKWLKQSSTSSVKFNKVRKSWFFCMEHTGVYTFPLCKFLQSKKLDYTLINPLHLKHSLGLRRGKSDAADAADIARFAFLHIKELDPFRLASDKLLIIKNLLSLRRRLVNSKKGLDVAAKELFDFAPQVSAEVSRHSQKNSKYFKKTIDEIENKILHTITEDKELHRLYELLNSIKGVGLIIGAGMLVYTVGFTAFQTSRQFATYIGIAPFSRTSGTSLNTPARVSHLAHKKLKGWISNGAASATRHDKELRAYYERRIADGKNKFVVQNAIRNKFLHRIFAVIKRGTPYVELTQFKN